MMSSSAVIIPHMTDYIDIGLNLTGSSFKSDLEEVMQRAQNASVEQMIVTGTDIEHSKAAIELCEQYSGRLYSTAGMHPHYADDYSPVTQQQLRDLCHQESVVAVGECGLDFNRNFSTPKNQLSAFESQLELAAEVEMPVFLHQRDAHTDFLRVISNARSELGDLVAHCFTGSVEEAVDYLEQDMYIGVTGWICDERRGKALQEAVKEIPLDRIMLETDAPYLLPRDLNEKPVQSRRNEPCYLPHICNVVAGYMGVDADELAVAAAKNSKRFFNI